MKTKLQQIADMLTETVGNNYIFLTEAIEVQTTVHGYPQRVWGLQAKKDKSVWLLDADENESKLQESDVNADKMIEAVYEEVTRIHNQYCLKTA